jgi:glycerol-3-phosphate acyltransferase PlsX
VAISDQLDFGKKRGRRAMNMVHIAVDAMGGDHAPEEIVAGAIQGARDLNLKVSLVGDPDAIRFELSRV